MRGNGCCKALAWECRGFCGRSRHCRDGLSTPFYENTRRDTMDSKRNVDSKWNQIRILKSMGHESNDLWYYLYVCVLCICMWQGQMCLEQTWKSVDSLESACLASCDFRNWTQVIRLGSNHLYMWAILSAPSLPVFKDPCLPHMIWYLLKAWCSHCNYSCRLRKDMLKGKLVRRNDQEL